MSNIAFIFPAFITEYTLKEIDFLKSNRVDFNDYIQKASKIIGKELPGFTYDSPVYKNDELLSQIIAYLFSCAINDILLKKGIVPKITAGYSMGIYANLYSVNSINLEDGIRLIYKAYTLVSEVSCTMNYGMGAVIGLTIEDVSQLIETNKLNAEIINVNNEHSLVIAGKLTDIEILIVKAKEEGAFSAGKLTVNTPYHSHYLLQFASTFQDFIKTLDIRHALIPIVSTYDQRVFKEAEEVRKELVLNLTRKINWYETKKKLVDSDANIFYECGAGKDLTKIARFIEGDYKIQSIYKN